MWADGHEQEPDISALHGAPNDVDNYIAALRMSCFYETGVPYASACASAARCR